MQASKKILSILAISILFFLCGWSSSLTPVSFNKTYLNLELTLTSQQQDKIVKLFIMLKKQKINDYQLYKSNPTALYRTAQQRIRMQDTIILNLLDTTQRQRFKHLQLLRDKNNEFFIINETLFPDEKQSLLIQDILEGYKKKAKIMMALLESRGKEKYFMNSDDGGGIRGRGRGRRMSGSRGMKKNSPMESLNKKKFKEIEILLTESQKKLYSKVKSIIKKEQKKKWQNDQNK